MPLFYVSPNIPTDPQEMRQQLVPDPLANALQRQLQSFETIPADPIMMHKPGIEYPGVPRNYGWRLSLIDWPIVQFRIPLQAPDVQRSNLSFTQQVQAAARPTPTLAASGVTVALRAPGINEGYS